MNVRSHKANPERCQRHCGCLEAGPPGRSSRKPGPAAGGRGVRDRRDRRAAARQRALARPLHPLTCTPPSARPRRPLPRPDGGKDRGGRDEAPRLAVGSARAVTGDLVVDFVSAASGPTAPRGRYPCAGQPPFPRDRVRSSHHRLQGPLFCGPRSAARWRSGRTAHGLIPVSIWTKRPHFTRRGRARGAGGEPEPACPCQRRGTIFARRIPHPPEDPADVGGASKRHDRSCAMSPLCRRTRAGRGAARAITGRDGALSDFSAMAGSNRPCRKATGEVP
jgi:hypothetical protein